MDYQPFKDAIMAWVKSQVDSSVTVYWMEQGPVPPRPPRPCINMKIVTPSVKIGGKDDLRYVGGNFVVNGPRKMLVSFNSYGVEAIEIMTDLRDSIDDPDVIDQLGAAGLAFVREGDVENLTQLLDSNYETRAHIDIEFGYNIENATGIVEIDKISINGVDVPAS